MALRITSATSTSYDDRVAQFAQQLGLGSVQLHTPDNLDGSSGCWEVGRPARTARADRE